MFFCLKPVLENPQLFVRARAGAGAKFQIFSGRGRARGPILKFFAGAGAKFLNFCGRGRARGPQKFLRAEAGGAPARKAPQGHPRAPARVFFSK